MSKANDGIISDATRAFLKQKWPHLTPSQVARLVEVVLDAHGEERRDAHAYALAGVDHHTIGAAVAKAITDDATVIAVPPSAEQILGAELRLNPMTPSERITRYRALAGMSDEERLGYLPELNSGGGSDDAAAGATSPASKAASSELSDADLASEARAFLGPDASARKVAAAVTSRKERLRLEAHEESVAKGLAFKEASGLPMSAKDRLNLHRARRDGILR